MEKKCSKCAGNMVEGVIDNLGPFNAYKKEGLKNKILINDKFLSPLNPFICPNCGFIEFYVENPEKFK